MNSINSRDNNKLNNDMDNQLINSNNQLINALDISKSTLSTLSHQKESLQESDKILDKVDTKLNITNRILVRMNSFYKTVSSVLSKNRKEIECEQKAAVLEKVQSQQQGEYIKEGDDILDDILANVKNLKVVGKTINSELILHEELLDSIDEKIEISSTKVKRINRKIDRLKR